MAQAYPTFSGRLVGVADLRVSGVSHRRTKAAVCRAGILEQIIKPITNSGKVRARVVMRQPARALLARPRCLSTPRRPQKLELKEGIANFYDESSQLWESMWGAPPRAAPPRTRRAVQASTCTHLVQASTCTTGTTQRAANPGRTRRRRWTWWSARSTGQA